MFSLLMVVDDPFVVAGCLLVMMVRLLMMVVCLLVMMVRLLAMMSSLLRTLMAAMVRGLAQVVGRLLMMMDGLVAMMGRLLVMMSRLLVVMDSPVMVADGPLVMIALDGRGRLLLLSEGGAAESHRASGNHPGHGKSSESFLDHKFLHVCTCPTFDLVIASEGPLGNESRIKIMKTVRALQPPVMTTGLKKRPLRSFFDKWSNLEN